ncbi:cell surface ecto-5'-nucleotidase Nt5e [Streptococcus gordonii]|uniref:5'-nucleotidase family protein n=1 Tax=Streptococcus gordonii (strain Challis / ATCC 35105 / BCRC 15272 / CH1 / DL1 / V288) TaxID=467705 RepID=A8AXM1_STRGC|nr:cell surface ecto-5'-nucleotidase Nt5e [Streptococcus gordonii]ABV10362.1 5'-nucleotidase family protein [Streptococcus gordonii str. Challis substr. CH1]MBZ2137336.1 5'-nucleotidase C-terminal domain-containing protein [Streptococcus gordonii]MCY7138718.1 cell surface ecto-5'-nucleotidase Nt5e [Streptococcus gordonii]QGS43593.1 bifunctional metallophosphatase/5'-nucleotidase [Streptococcus gordonii]VEE21668.1 5'-nucleotidase [Streptococcus gordonii]
MQKKKILLPLLLLAPAFLAHQVYADEQVASEPSQEVAAAASAQEWNVPDGAIDTSVQGGESVSGQQSDLPEANIIHTNDVHGRIVEEKGVIGDAKLAAVIEEERKNNPSTLVVDAGDAFQGLPISNSSKGEERAKLLNEMGYDAMAVGNHEFDFGLDEAKKYKEILNFPLLSSNTYVNGARLFEASTIVDKDKNVVGDEFVVIGVTTPETATKTHPKNVQGVTFKDPISEVNSVIDEVEARAAAEGKTYKNYVVLAHLGVDTTTPVEWRGSTLAEALSNNPKLKGKRVTVIDGHSHTVQSTTYGDNVTYNQTGSYLNNIGKITYKANQLLGNPQQISAASTKDVVPNAKIAAMVKKIKEAYDAENAKVVRDNSPVELNGQRENVRVRETNLGNVVADALYEYGQTGFSHKTDLAVTNGGGLRETIAKDKPITKGDVIAVLPFGNTISQIKVTGQNIADMFAKSLGSILQEKNGQPVLDENGQPLLEPSGGFLQVSGAKVYYDTTLPAEKRILHIEIKNPETGKYENLDLAKEYYLTTNDFLAAGGDGYTMLGGAREEGPSMDVAFADYLAKADLSAYSVINPNSRTISISSKKDSDGDGVSDIEEIKNGTDPSDPKSYPGRTDVPNGQSNQNQSGQNYQPLPNYSSNGNVVQPSPKPAGTVTVDPAKEEKKEEVATNSKPLTVNVAKTFTSSKARLPETGTKESPALLIVTLFTAFLGIFGFKKSQED